MSRRKIERLLRGAAAVATLGAVLAACSDPGLYLDRRDTIALSGNDAVSANMVEEMVDPWPRYSNDKNIAFNGERMQRAVECYRKDKVTPPVDLDPSDDNSSGSSSTAAPTAATACDQSGAGTVPQAPGGTAASALGSTAAK
jgi:hypothetical protein